MEHVPDGLNCPVCGERRADMLELNHDDVVKCLTCKTRYEISHPADPDSILVLNRTNG